MCGIGGIFNYRCGKQVNRANLEKMGSHMISRGPDGEGIWVHNSKNIGFVHRRLSILDTSVIASQPLISPNTRNQIVFNGEIYNFKELRKNLISKGFNFRTTGDTEVLLYMYEQYETDMLELLRGMYAFAIWDEKKRRLFCARDPFGIKPFYFVDDGSTFQFASQVKTLLCKPDVSPELDPAGHAGFFIWGSVPEPYTLFKNIKPLEPDSYMLISEEKIIRKKNKTILSIFLDETVTKATSKDVFEALEDSVMHHMVSDVEVGTFLSSGIDSTMISVLASKYSSGKIKAITAGFREYINTNRDETVCSCTIAEMYNFDHRISWIDKDVFKQLLPVILNKMDQVTIDGINTFMISKIAASFGLKVILSGIGGDELLGGYSEFKTIPKLVSITRLIPAGKVIGEKIRKVLDSVVKHRYSKHKSLLEYGTTYFNAFLLRKSLSMPWNLHDEIMDGIITKEAIEEMIISVKDYVKDVTSIKNSRLKISYLELLLYLRNQLLRDTDWASMAHSLEIRVPFLDVQFLKTATAYLRTASSQKKDIALHLNPNLPDSIINRKKTGFSIPVNIWIDRSIKGLNRYSLRSWSKVVYSQYYT